MRRLLQKIYGLLCSEGREEMIGKRVSAVIWNDTKNPARGANKRTRFIASYILDDGYGDIESCKEAVPHPERWAYVCFCGNWYAVNAQSYDLIQLVSKDAVHKKRGYAQHEVYSPEEAEFPHLYPHSIGPKYWVDGIYRDFLRIDPNLQVVDHNGIPFGDILTVSNTVVVIGIFFFATDVCIRRPGYVNHVLTHYYNDRSMEERLEKIEVLKGLGIEFWNPFSENIATDEKDKNRQKRAREKGIDMGVIHDDRERIGDVPVMDASDLFADRRADEMPFKEGSNKRRFWIY